MNAQTIFVVLLVLLVAVSAVQAVQLVGLSSQVEGNGITGAVISQPSSSGSSGVSVPSNLQNLPAMVGGC